MDIFPYFFNHVFSEVGFSNLISPLTSNFVCSFLVFLSEFLEEKIFRGGTVVHKVSFDSAIFVEIWRFLG